MNRIAGEIFRQLKRTTRVVSGFSSFKNFLSEIASLFEFIAAYRRNNYRDISPATLIVTVLGVIYFISPLDLLPDLIPILGWIDDIAVVRIIIELIRSDLSRFRIWKSWMEERATGNNSSVE